MSEVYARQTSIPLSIPKSVAIIGVGGVGSWLALFLALAGVTELWLWDHDTVSETNLNRLPLTPDTIGKGKSDAMADSIRLYRPDCSVYAMGAFTPSVASSCGMHAQWIAAGTDSWASRKMIAQWALEHLVQYIELSAEGEWGSATGAPADFATSDETKPGYASVPVWVGPCVSAATIVAAYILHNRGMEADHVIRLGWNGRTFEMFTTVPPPTLKTKPKLAFKLYRCIIDTALNTICCGDLDCMGCHPNGQHLTIITQAQQPTNQG